MYGYLAYKIESKRCARRKFAGRGPYKSLGIAALTIKCVKTNPSPACIGGKAAAGLTLSENRYFRRLRTGWLRLYRGAILVFEDIEKNACAGFARRYIRVQTPLHQRITFEHRPPLGGIGRQTLGPAQHRACPDDLVEIFRNDGVIGDQVRQGAGQVFTRLLSMVKIQSVL